MHANKLFGVKKKSIADVITHDLLDQDFNLIPNDGLY
jgi:hypothetical protein